jgi:SAM-dependent methyltransferase
MGAGSRARARGGAAEPQGFEPWVDGLFQRQLTELTWSEIARALAALAQDYVQRRHRLGRSGALAGRGKRAAFLLYYAPRHHLIVREVLQRLGAPERRPPRILDLGCGTGAAGAAWSALYRRPPPVLGVDESAWVLAEARHTYRVLGVPGRRLRARIERLRWPAPPHAVVAAFALNEVQDQARARVLVQVGREAARGSAVLVLEPLATRIAPWWEQWVRSFRSRGGRADEWHFDLELPEMVVRLGRSAGLDPRQLGARSLWLPQGAAPAAGGELSG